MPLALGVPGERYPGHWSVYRWLEGETASVERMDLRQAATALAAFIVALQRIDPAGAPPPGAHNFYRGLPLSAGDRQTREAIDALHEAIDRDAVTTAWEAALRTPPWHGRPVWIHGDLLPGNLLLRERRLSAVIDFGGLAAGDPACDVMAAWTLCSAETRPLLRASLPVDDATWARGRGWALSVALIQLPYYGNTKPTLAATARRTIREVFADRGDASSPQSTADGKRARAVSAACVMHRRRGVQKPAWGTPVRGR